jgi:hypothetical protein
VPKSPRTCSWPHPIETHAVQVGQTTMGKNCHGYSFYLRKFALELNPLNLEFLKRTVPFKIFSGRVGFEETRDFEERTRCEEIH